MQYNSQTDKNDLVSHASFLLGGGVTISASGSYLLTDFTRNANERMRQIWALIFESQSGWKWDDSNNTDLPQGVTNLVANQSKYALPSDGLIIERIECADQNGQFSKLQVITQEQIQEAYPEFMSTASNPMYAKLLGTTVELYPAPSYNSTGGLKVYFTRDVVEFDHADTTKTPGFASPFHQMVAIGAALDFAMSRGMNDKIVLLTGMWVEQARQLQYYYSNRFKANKPLTFQPRYRSAR
jgi:hypothetical protein